MPQVMAQSSNLDTLDVAVRDIQLGLTALKMGSHLPGKVRYAYSHMSAQTDELSGWAEPRQCSKRLWDAPGQT
jgi:hypothetical protein